MSLCSWKTSCAVCFLTLVLLTNLHLAPSWCLSSLNGPQEIEQLFLWAESGFLEESSHLILLSQWLEIGFICQDFWCALFDVGKKVLAVPSLASFIAVLTCFGFSHRLVALPFHSGAVGQETWKEFLISNAPILLICEYAWVSVQYVSVSACVSVCVSVHEWICKCVCMCECVLVLVWMCNREHVWVSVQLCKCECAGVSVLVWVHVSAWVCKHECACASVMNECAIVSVWVHKCVRACVMCELANMSCKCVHASACVSVYMWVLVCMSATVSICVGGWVCMWVCDCARVSVHAWVFKCECMCVCGCVSEHA